LDPYDGDDVGTEGDEVVDIPFITQLKKNRQDFVASVKEYNSFITEEEEEVEAEEVQVVEQTDEVSPLLHAYSCRNNCNTIDGLKDERWRVLLMSIL
jgi:hypothetical protein